MSGSGGRGTARAFLRSLQGAIERESNPTQKEKDRERKKADGNDAKAEEDESD